MNKTSLLKTVVAIALLFTVNINANAQFGKLKRLAKSKAEQVINGQEEKNEAPAPSQETSADNNDNNNNNTVSSNDEMPQKKAGESDEQYRKRLRRWYDREQPQKLEQYDVEDAGGLQQYLGLTEGDDLLYWQYYNKEKPLYAGDGNGTINRIIEIMRITKNPYYDSYSGQKNYYTDNRKDLAQRFGYVDAQGKLKGNIASFLLKATGKDPKHKISKPIPAADGKALERVAIKTLKAFEAKYGRVEP